MPVMLDPIRHLTKGFGRTARQRSGLDRHLDGGAGLAGIEFDGQRDILLRRRRERVETYDSSCRLAVVDRRLQGLVRKHGRQLAACCSSIEDTAHELAFQVIGMIVEHAAGMTQPLQIAGLERPIDAMAQQGILSQSGNHEGLELGKKMPQSACLAYVAFAGHIGSAAFVNGFNKVLNSIAADHNSQSNA